jgi:hypothetical protein
VYNLCWSSAFVLGYQGGDRVVAEKLIAGEPFVVSEDDYEWLGSGIYFWKANPRRGSTIRVEKTHVQICVRNLACIKGVFRVPEDQLTI